MFLVVTLVPVALLTLFVVPGLLPASDAAVARFRECHELPDTNRVTRFVRYYLTTGNRLRRLGFIAAVTLPPLVTMALTGRATPVDVISTKVLVALMVATLLAEVTLTRSPGAARRRVASLRPRRLRTYLPRTLLYGPLVIGLAAAAAWGGSAFLDDPPSADTGAGAGGAAPADVSGNLTVTTGSGLDDDGGPSAGDVATGAALALLLPVLTAAAEAWIVRRPQPFTDVQLVAADDAARAASTRRLAAMACCIALLGLAGGLTWYAAQLDGTVDAVVGVSVTVCLVLAAWAWFERGAATSSAGALVRADAQGPAPSATREPV